jgi:hypothetical protein
MYKRLAKTITQRSREHELDRKIRSKILFFVEGAETEKIYLNELKKIVPSSKKVDIEIFDRWKELSGESNQLKIVEKTRGYMEICGGITRKQKNKINSIINLLEKHELTMEDILTKITELNTFLGEEILSTKEFLLNQLLSIKTCFDFDEEIDKICFVLDRDCGSFKPEQYDQVIEICRECNYELGMSTPNFEFFLLIHLSNLSDIDNQLLFENKSELTYKVLRKRLKDEYDLNYRKEKYNAAFFVSKFNDYKINIDHYVQNNNELKNNVGSSLGTILKNVLED